MTHTMPALVLNGPGDVQVAEKPIPTPGPGEVVHLDVSGAIEN